MLLQHWKKDSQLDSAKNSKPSFQDILNQMKEFFEVQEKEGLDINRVHLHPYGSFFMCYDKNKWHSAHDAIIKSSIAVPKYCVAGPEHHELGEESLNNFEISDLPQSFEHPNRAGEVIEIKKETLTYNFDLNDKIDCYL